MPGRVAEGQRRYAAIYANKFGVYMTERSTENAKRTETVRIETIYNGERANTFIYAPRFDQF